jgi:hypothetical protein
MIHFNQTRFASMFAAVFCTVVTIGFSVAPAVSHATGLVA